MFFQNQTFSIERKPEKARFCLAFLISKKAEGVHKSQNCKILPQKANWQPCS